jgi:hypothetical protein
MIKIRMPDPLISPGIAKKHGESRKEQISNCELRISNEEASVQFAARNLRVE